MAVTPVPDLTEIPPFPALADRAAGTYNSKAYAWAQHMASVFPTELDAVAQAAASNAGAAEAAAGSAENSASTATTARNQAVTARDEAVPAGTAAVTAWTNFDKRYLGPHATAPVADNQGQPLQVGAVYWSSVSHEFFVWDGSLWKEAVIPVGDYLTANGVATLTNKTLQGFGITGAVLLGGGPGAAGQTLLSQGPGQPPVWGTPVAIAVAQVFSATAAIKASLGGGNAIYKAITAPFTLSGTPSRRASSGTLGVFAYNGSHGNVYSTADGETFTARVMPSSQIWQVACNEDGTAWLAFVGGATTMASSANGTSWAAATALPGNAVGTAPVLAGLGSTWIIRAASGTSDGYRSTDGGLTWSTITFPAANLNTIFSVGSNFVAYGSGSTYRTSANGDTGFWQTRSVPGGAASFTDLWKTEPGKLYGRTSNGTYVTTDGVNWTLVEGSAQQLSAGVVVHGSVPVAVVAGAVRTYHAGRWQERQALPESNRSTVTAIRVGTSLIFAHSGSSDTAIFTMRTDDADAAGVFKN